MFKRTLWVGTSNLCLKHVTVYVMLCLAISETQVSYVWRACITDIKCLSKICFYEYVKLKVVAVWRMSTSYF